MKKIVVAIALIFNILLSGCISGEEIYGKISDFFKKPEKYEWKTIIDVKEEFKWIDIINPEIAKNVSIPIIIREKTKYIHIVIEVNFSNPISSGIEFLSQGRLNLTILTPSEKIEKEYCTTAKSRKYEEYFYFEAPLPGEWAIILKLIGCGEYRIFVEAYVA
ncbi:MAG: hypothetical protein QXW78_05180 [Candidatus Thermoplasmatota archaeon]